MRRGGFARPSRRAISDKARIVRLPANYLPNLRSFENASAQLAQKLARRPSLDDVAQHLDLSLHDVHRLQAMVQPPLSLDEPKGMDNCNLSDIVMDPTAENQSSQVIRAALRKRLVRAMRSLTARERDVLRLRFGLQDGHSRSLAQLGEVFSVSRERIRQIEQTALAKIRRGSQAEPLSTFVE